MNALTTATAAAATFVLGIATMALTEPYTVPDTYAHCTEARDLAASVVSQHDLIEATRFDVEQARTRLERANLRDQLEATLDAYTWTVDAWRTADARCSA